MPRHPFAAAKLGFLLLALLIALAFFGEVLVGGRVYYSGDVARQYLPQRAALRRALQTGTLPWWEPTLGAGYPLLAEGEVGALYPLNWPLALLLPDEVSITATILLHEAIAGVGMYLLARRLGRSRPAALWAALVLALGGFYLAHLNHLSILSVAAWLPWLFWLSANVLNTQVVAGDRLQVAGHAGLPRTTGEGQGKGVRPPRRRGEGRGEGPNLQPATSYLQPGTSALALALVVALQFLAGHPQISLLGLLALGTWAVFCAWPAQGARVAWGRVALWLAAMGMGTALALPQLLSTLELSDLSQRAGGLDPTFFTSFSLHPLLVVTYLFPFARGNPYPHGSVELMVYIGMVPLALAALALLRDRHRETWFWAALGVVGILLALGRWNPLYSLLRYVPVFNLFRVPARYTWWTGLALSILSAQGLDGLLTRWRAGCGVWGMRHGGMGDRLRVAGRAAPPLSEGEGRGEGAVPIVNCQSVGGTRIVIVAVSLLLVAAVAPRLTTNVDALVTMWWGLPVLFAAAAVALFWLAGRTWPHLWVLLAFALLLSDLAAYDRVLDLTYNVARPRAWVAERPAALGLLESIAGSSLTSPLGERGQEAVGQEARGENPQPAMLGRLYTKEEILPALSVMRESFYPNMALTHGLSSANLYLPLVPQRYADYLAHLTPERLNRLNVRYYLIPQLLPVDAQSELYDVENPFSSLPTNRWLALEPLDLAGVTVESYLSHAADLPNGTPAAELLLRDVADQVITVPLRVGLETAEWAYERDDVQENIAHSLPEVATTWPASSGFPPRDHPGHTYRVQATFDRPLRLAAVMLRPILPVAFVRVERVRLALPGGGEELLAHRLGLGDHTIVYRSEDVLIYRNEDALPRAYTLPVSMLPPPQGRELALPATLRLENVDPAGVLGYEAQRVSLRATLAEPGYLILADLDYPGWRATVDGAPAPILCADSIYRAVALPPGEHAVEFHYR